MDKFIIWYDVDGEEDFMVVTAFNEDDARRKFDYNNGRCVTEIRKVDMNSEAWLAYV